MAGVGDWQVGQRISLCIDNSDSSISAKPRGLVDEE